MNKQSRIKSAVAAIGSIFAIIGAIIVGLQNSGIMPIATEAQEGQSAMIVAIVGIIVKAIYEIVGYYNNPTNKGGF